MRQPRGRNRRARGRNPLHLLRPVSGRPFAKAKAAKRVRVDLFLEGQAPVSFGRPLWANSNVGTGSTAQIIRSAESRRPGRQQRECRFAPLDARPEFGCNARLAAIR